MKVTRKIHSIFLELRMMKNKQTVCWTRAKVLHCDRFHTSVLRSLSAQRCRNCHKVKLLFMFSELFVIRTKDVFGLMKLNINVLCFSGSFYAIPCKWPIHHGGPRFQLSFYNGWFRLCNSGSDE